ncbi:DrmB family protein [Achromobacter xylosoxidans]|uniref:DrmB family protein n=1 Tax=Alcaligenes xylosoxydans xylosoxydans TaxID=85698 RepID=UPI001EEA481E|nr:DrmB family protein [Achromobacter xylosoxidans]
MSRNDLGELRRSAAAATFGPGSIVDFRAGGASISAVAAGLEEWDSNFPPGGMRHPQAIREERLQKKLGVKGFRLPPVRDPSSDRDAERSLVAVRFPSWLQCPHCDRIAPEGNWADAPGQAGRWCPPCTAKAPGQNRVFVVPVRFVMACESGHLDEFPWHVWVGHTESCRNQRGFLKLTSERPGLAGLILSCPDVACGSRRSMDGIFSAATWKRFPDCRGKRPWLAGPDERCTHKGRAVQRGASNLYFPVIESALSIPPWSDRLQEALGVHWDPIADTLPEDRSMFIGMLARGALAPVLAELGLTPETLAGEIARRFDAEQAIETVDLRQEEYRQFTGGVAAEGLDREFEIRPQAVPPSIASVFSRLVKAVRLREVRAVKGFTRIQPPGDPESPAVARLSVRTDLDWLPAIEVRGEGIFLEFDLRAISAWESQDAIRDRAARIDARWQTEWRERHGADGSTARPITPRFLLLHTFAHALMRQLTLECGYSSTALRERLYVNQLDSSMAGVLVYTATTDDDGTLGGLQRQGDPERIQRTIIAALRAQAWCSSDPLCIEEMMAPDDGLSLAACHSCVLAPETSCEEFNRFLDRATLVGTPSDPGLGFFRRFLDDVVGA